MVPLVGANPHLAWSEATRKSGPHAGETGQVYSTSPPLSRQQEARTVMTGTNTKKTPFYPGLRASSGRPPVQSRLD
jgi:hypothetical protein